MWIIIHLCFLLTVAGTQHLKITLDAPKDVSPCTTGLRGDIDKFFVTGTVTQSDYLENDQSLIAIQAVTKTGQSEHPCGFVLTKKDCNLPNRKSLKCYCNDKNVATEEAHFVVNFTVYKLLSEAVIRVYLSFNATADVYSINNLTMPTIYDLPEVRLNLTVYGVMGTLSIPGSCTFSLTLNRSNHLRLCCFNTPTPCHPRISFGADVVSSDSCVSYPTSPLNSDGVTRDLVLSFSVCNQVENIAGENCQVTTTPDVFIPATETPGTVGTSATRSTTRSTIETTRKTLITSTSSENPRPTTMPFLWTTDMNFKRGDNKSLVTTFGPALLLAGLSFVVAFAYVFWVSRETSDDNKPFNNHPEAGEAVEENDRDKHSEANDAAGEKDSDKHSEANNAAGEKDSDTFKQEDNSSKVSTLKL